MGSIPLIKVQARNNDVAAVTSSPKRNLVKSRKTIPQPESEKASLTGLSHQGPGTCVTSVCKPGGLVDLLACMPKLGGETVSKCRRVQV